MLDKNPETRYSADQALKHPFITGKPFVIEEKKKEKKKNSDLSSSMSLKQFTPKKGKDDSSESVKDTPNKLVSTSLNSKLLNMSLNSPSIDQGSVLKKLKVVISMECKASPPTEDRMSNVSREKSMELFKNL